MAKPIERVASIVLGAAAFLALLFLGIQLAFVQMTGFSNMWHSTPLLYAFPFAAIFCLGAGLWIVLAHHFDFWGRGFGFALGFYQLSLSAVFLIANYAYIATLFSWGPATLSLLYEFLAGAVGVLFALLGLTLPKRSRKTRAIFLSLSWLEALAVAGLLFYRVGWISVYLGCTDGLCLAYSASFIVFISVLFVGLCLSEIVLWKRNVEDHDPFPVDPTLRD